MVVNQANLWWLSAAASGTAIVAILRCLALFIGLRIALRSAPKKDHHAIYREFARALGFKSRFRETGMEILPGRRSDDDFGGRARSRRSAPDDE